MTFQSPWDQPSYKKPKRKKAKKAKKVAPKKKAKKTVRKKPARKKAKKLSKKAQKMRAEVLRKYPGTRLGSWPEEGPYHYIAKGALALYPQESACGIKVGWGRGMLDPNDVRMLDTDILVTCPKCKKKAKRPRAAKTAWGADLVFCKKCSTYKLKGKKCDVCLSHAQTMTCPRGWYMEGDACVHPDHQVGVRSGIGDLSGAKEFWVVYRNTSGRGRVKWIGRGSFPTARKALAEARRLIKLGARLAIPRPETIVATPKQFGAMLKAGKGEWIKHRNQDYWPLTLEKDQVTALVGTKVRKGARRALFVRADSSLDPRYGRGPGYVPRGPWAEAKLNPRFL